jgi:hypothetical protein
VEKERRREKKKSRGSRGRVKSAAHGITCTAQLGVPGHKIGEAPHEFPTTYRGGGGTERRNPDEVTEAGRARRPRRSRDSRVVEGAAISLAAARRYYDSRDDGGNQPEE